jgi:hypothetical protein
MDERGWVDQAAVVAESLRELGDTFFVRMVEEGGDYVSVWVEANDGQLRMPTAKEAAALRIAAGALPHLVDEVARLRQDNGQLQDDVGALARIVRAVGSLQLAGRMSDDLAYALHGAVEGEHRFVADDGQQIVWPEQDLTEVAEQLDLLLRAQGIEHHDE